MSAPSVHIVIELEAVPRVRTFWQHEADEARLADWLEAHPEQAGLIARALELQEQEPAA